MKNKAFIAWIAALLLLAAIGLWAAVEGAARHEDRLLLDDFVRIFSREETQ